MADRATIRQTFVDAYKMAASKKRVAFRPRTSKNEGRVTCVAIVSMEGIRGNRGEIFLRIMNKLVID